MNRKRTNEAEERLRLSLLLDGTRTFVSKYESGERYLTFTEVVKLCGILGMDAAAVAEEIATLTVMQGEEDESSRDKPVSPRS